MVREEMETRNAWLTKHFFVLVLQVYIVCVLQTSFNYAALYYEDDLKYVKNIGTEFTLRTQFECYYEHAFDNTWKIMMFLGWV